MIAQAENVLTDRMKNVLGRRLGHATTTTESEENKAATSEFGEAFRASGPQRDRKTPSKLERPGSRCWMDRASRERLMGNIDIRKRLSASGSPTQPSQQSSTTDIIGLIADIQSPEKSLSLD